MKRTSLFPILVVALLFVVCAPAIVSASAVLVDDFFDGNNWTLYNTGPQSDYGTRIIGGQRDTTFNVVAGAPSLEHFIGVNWMGIEYKSGSGGQADWSLEYGRDYDLNYDMVFNERVLFSVEVLSKNIPDLVHLTVAVTSDRGMPNEMTATVEKDITGTYTLPPTWDQLNPPIQFPYSEFSGVNFGDVDYLKFTFVCDAPTSPDGLELMIGNLTNCPEPATILLLGLGATIAAHRKKREQL